MKLKIHLSILKQIIIILICFAICLIAIRFFHGYRPNDYFVFPEQEWTNTKLLSVSYDNNDIEIYKKLLSSEDAEFISSIIIGKKFNNTLFIIPDLPIYQLSYENVENAIFIHSSGVVSYNHIPHNSYNPIFYTMKLSKAETARVKEILNSYVQ